MKRKPIPFKTRKIVFEEEDMEMISAVKKILGQMTKHEQETEYELTEKQSELCCRFYSKVTDFVE